MIYKTRSSQIVWIVLDLYENNCLAKTFPEKCVPIRHMWIRKKLQLKFGKIFKRLFSITSSFENHDDYRLGFQMIFE